ncbi:LacI family DNA-binding transcriptional regulator [Kribbella sp. WER1]
MQHTNRGPVPHGHVTLAQVAQRAGVSAQSVSNALNNPDRVAAQTRKRSWPRSRSSGTSRTCPRGRSATAVRR